MSTLSVINIGNANEGNGDTPFDAFTKVKNNFTLLNDEKSELDHTHIGTSITDLQSSITNNSEVLANTSAQHSHSNTSAIDSVIDTGDGLSVLTNAGSYLANSSLKITNTELNTFLKDNFKILPIKPVSHLHLKGAKTGIVLSDSWLKLELNTTDYTIKTEGGFTFDDTNDRVIWGEGNLNAITIDCSFKGDAGIKVTDGIGGGVLITLGLFVNGVLKLETPLNFTNQDDDKAYGANGYPTINQGEYVEFFIKADTGQTPTITLNHFYTTIEGR